MAQRKLSLKEAAVFKNMERTSRKIVYKELEKGKEFSEILDQYCEIIAFEKKLKTLWHNNLIKILSDSGFDGYIYNLFQNICKKDECKRKRVKQVYPKALKYANKLSQKGKPSNQAELFIQITHDYLQKKENLNRDIEEMIEQKVPVSELIQKLFQKYEEEENKREEKIFLIQTIKHIKNQQKQKKIIAPELIKIALDSRFSYDNKVFKAQIEIMHQTYYFDDNSLRARKTKKICYDFIEEILLHQKRVSGEVISFLFLGDWISDETTKLLYRAKDILIETGLNYPVFHKIKRLYEKIDLSSEQKLNASEKLIITLHETFKPS